MTHLERFRLLVEAIDGKPPTNKRLNEVADDFISYRRDQVEAAGFNPAAKMTNAQKASVVLDSLSHHVRSVQSAMFNRRSHEQLKAEKIKKGLL